MQYIQNNPILAGGLAVGAVAIALGNRHFNGGVSQIQKDLKGQVFVITGANEGIGKETARELSKQGATVVLACRNQAKAQPLLEELQKKYPQQNCEFIKLNLSDLKSVREFSDTFNSKYDRLDVLLNNAGIMMVPDRRLSSDGYELQFATNHLGHFLLTSLLLEKLKKTPKSRVVNVSSNGHVKMNKKAIGKMNFEDLQYEKNYEGAVVYAQSKLANILFTNELQRQFEKNNLEIKTVSLHPGVVRTNLGRYMIEGMPLYRKALFTALYPVFQFFTKTPWYGAQTNIYCCIEDFEKLKEGQYYADCKTRWTSEAAKSVDDAQKLWQISEQLVGNKFQF